MSDKPLANPPIWAGSRADLAESSPKFNSQFAGITAGEKGYPILGILLDGQGGTAGGFYNGGGVIMTRAYAVPNGRLNTRYRKKIENTQETMVKKEPVGVVFGKKYSALPVRFRPGVAYAPAAFYYITSVFAVTAPSHTKTDTGTALYVMVKLECAQPLQERWWAGDTVSQGDTQGPPALPTAQQTCLRCNKPSDVIFTEGWICLNLECVNAGKKDDGELLKTFTYLPGFQRSSDLPLRSTDPQSSWCHERPLLQVPSSRKQLQPWLRKLWRGYICPCGRMNARRNRNHWSCLSSDNASHVYQPEVQKPVIADAFRATYKDQALMTFTNEATLRATKFLKSKYMRAAGVELEREEYHEDFVLYQFRLGPDARVLVRWWRQHVLSSPGGADEITTDLLKLFHNDQIQMSRMPFGYAAGTMNRNFLSPSYESQYKYKVDLGYSAVTPPLVKQLLTQMEAKAQTVLGCQPKFNQIQLTEYFPQQHMGMHTDGEVGVGPCIGSFSYGDPCTMRFGPRRHIDAGRDTKTKTAILNDPAPPGCSKYNERQKLRTRYMDQIDAIRSERRKDELRKEWREELQALMANVAIRGSRSENVTLEIPLPHGAEVFMFGLKFQTDYEHSIRFEGAWRLNVTTRTITNAKATMSGIGGDGEDPHNGEDEDEDGEDGGDEDEDEDENDDDDDDDEEEEEEEEEEDDDDDDDDDDDQPAPASKKGKRPPPSDDNQPGPVAKKGKFRPPLDDGQPNPSGRRPHDDDDDDNQPPPPPPPPPSSKGSRSAKTEGSLGRRSTRLKAQK